jgi:hypothetical protein
VVADGKTHGSVREIHMCKASVAAINRAASVFSG